MLTGYGEHVPLLPVPTRVPTRAELVDEYGRLERKVLEFKPVADRHAFLKNVIKAWYDDHPADQPATAAGALYTIQVSPRSTERKIVSIAKVIKALGRDLFLSVCNVPISALEEHLGQSGAAKLLSESRSGSRRLKVVPNADPQLEKAA